MAVQEGCGKGFGPSDFAMYTPICDNDLRRWEFYCEFCSPLKNHSFGLGAW